MTVREALAEATLYIPRRDAELLLAHVAGRPRTWVLSQPESRLAPELTAGVTPLVQRLADVGTGSGAIALALTSRLPGAAVHALDISQAALAVAQANAEQLGLADYVRFRHSDLLGALPAEAMPLDAVVSNPPYVALGDAAGMQREVVEHEPHVALFAGADGLEVYRRLVPQAHAALRPGGLLAMELGFGQSHALAAMLASRSCGAWQDVRFVRDHAGIERVVLAGKR